MAVLELLNLGRPVSLNAAAFLTMLVSESIHLVLMFTSESGNILLLGSVRVMNILAFFGVRNSHVFKFLLQCLNLRRILSSQGREFGMVMGVEG